MYGCCDEPSLMFGRRPNHTRIAVALAIKDGGNMVLTHHRTFRSYSSATLKPLTCTIFNVLRLAGVIQDQLEQPEVALRSMGQQLAVASADGYVLTPGFLNC